LGRRVEGERQPGTVAVTALEEARVVGAVRGALDDRAHVLVARRAPGDRPAVRAQRARGLGGCSPEPVGAGEGGGADAQTAAVADEVTGPEVGVDLRAHVRAERLP